MIESKITELNSQLNELEDLRMDFIQMQNRIAHTFEDLEHLMDKNHQLSFLLDDIKTQISDIDLSNVGEIISEVEDKIGSLSYNYKKTLNAQKKSIYKIQNPFSNLMYFKKTEINNND